MYSLGYAITSENLTPQKIAATKRNAEYWQECHQKELEKSINDLLFPPPPNPYVWHSVADLIDLNT